jgi:tetratricopeptide (TPR) repeat protein
MPSALAALLAFAAFAQGGQDLWAETASGLLLLGAALVLLLRRSWGERAPGLRPPLARPILILLAALFASYLGSVHPEESLSRWQDFACAAVVFGLAAELLETDAARAAFCAAMAVAVAGECAVCLVQRAHESAGILGRQTVGTLANSNATAAFLVPWPPIFLYYLRGARSRRAAALWTAALAADLIALLLTGSSWAFVCLLAALPWRDGPRALSASSRRRALWAAAAAVAILALKPLLPSADQAGGSYASRLAWWAAGLRMLASRPLLGVGVGNFPSAYLAYRVEWGKIQHSRVAHSILFGGLGETGLAGAAAAAFLARSWLRAVRGERARARWPFALAVALLLAYSLADVALELPANLFLLAAFAGACVGPGPVRRPSRTFLLGAAAAALCAVPFIVAPWMASRRVVAGQQALEAGSLERAESLFRDAAELDGRSSEARRGLGRVGFERFRRASDRSGLDQAVAFQRQAAELDRLNGTLWGELGEYLLARGDRDQGLAMLSRAVDYHSPDRRFRAVLRALLGPTAAPRS